MFKVSNLHKEKKNGWTYLCCDFDTSVLQSNPFKEKTMWVAVQDEYEDMLSDTVYDPFVILPVYLGMHYCQDVHIEGNISPRLYHNITHYLMNIFDRFSDHTCPINFTVEGFDIVQTARAGRLIGTGISCGLDSLVTIYDNFIKETDPNYRINSLFFFNYGSCGDYGREETNTVYMERAKLNQAAARDLGLPMYMVDSNLHAYTHVIGGQKIGYLAAYSCALSMQKYIKRYLTSSNLSYDEISDNSILSRDFDIAEYCESYMPHLISTESMELVIDGCQYTRAEKMEHISDWEIAQKYLNVCNVPKSELHGHNCSCCNKCMWTLIPLEAIGKLDKFNKVFDIDIYMKNAFYWKCLFVSHYGKDSMETSIVKHAKACGLKLPNHIIAKMYVIISLITRKLANRKSV